VQDVTATAIRARDGDRSALDELVRRTIADVHRYCGALVDAPSADDLTQQTYLKVVQSLPRLRDDAAAGAWILSIARHTCIDEIRRRQRRRELESPGLFIDPPQRSDLQEHVAVGQLLAELDRERREAFVLTQILGLTYDEVADAIGCPIGTVRSRVYRARADLVTMVATAHLISAPSG
jgi:RNA polymerase sigma-70 factor, ECF subfamily